MLAILQQYQDAKSTIEHNLMQHRLLASQQDAQHTTAPQVRASIPITACILHKSSSASPTTAKHDITSKSYSAVPYFAPTAKVDISLRRSRFVFSGSLFAARFSAENRGNYINLSSGCTRLETISGVIPVLARDGGSCQVEYSPLDS